MEQPAVLQMLERVELPRSVMEMLDEYTGGSPAPMGEDGELTDDDRLVSLTKDILHTRKLAIDGRMQSGIEDIWRYCEDSYAGIDMDNAHEFRGNRWMKSWSPDGPVQKGDSRQSVDGSTLFPPFPRRYANAGVAKLQEILLAPDERPFDVHPTPVPEFIKMLGNHEQVELGGQLLERDPTAKEMNPGTGGTPEHPLPLMEAPSVDTSREPGKKLTYSQLAQERMDQAAEGAELAAKRIHDSMVETRFVVHSRRCIQDGGRLGTGIVKGPFPEFSVSVAVTTQQLPNSTTGQVEPAKVVEIRKEIVPSSKHVSPWNLYPDPGCGENIQDGEYIWERDDLSRAQLYKLMNAPGYSRKAIQRILESGQKPRRVVDTQEHQLMQQPSHDQMPYEVWFFYATLTAEQYALLGGTMNPPEEGDPSLKSEGDVYVQGTVVDDVVIQLVEQPNIKTGKFPYHVFNWLNREGHWAGIGVVEQGMPAQRLVTAALRRLMDNAGFSAGLQLIIDTDVIEPMRVEGEPANWKIEAIKLWKRKRGALLDDMTKAFHAVKFPDAHAQLSWLVEFGIRLWEETTNIPLVTQGWSGKTTPDTLGGAELQDSNANQLLRDTSVNYDLGVIVPYVTQRYEWHLLDPAVPNEEKIDMKIQAVGSTKMLDRYLQRQVFERNFPMLMQGARMFGINPKKLFEEVWRGYRMNPKAIQYSDAELKELEKQPPPEDPKISVAKIRAELEEKKLGMLHQYNMAELNVRREIAQLEYQTQVARMTVEERNALNANKTQLAKTTMELSTQAELAMGATHPAPEVATPLMEPAGRAPEGEAFQK